MPEFARKHTGTCLRSDEFHEIRLKKDPVFYEIYDHLPKNIDAAYFDKFYIGKIKIDKDLFTMGDGILLVKSTEKNHYKVKIN